MQEKIMIFFFFYYVCNKHMIEQDNTWVTLWLVTLVILVNHNVTRVQRNKKILLKRKKKDTCDIVVGQCHNVTNHNVTQVLPD